MDGTCFQRGTIRASTKAQHVMSNEFNFRPMVSLEMGVTEESVRRVCVRGASFILYVTLCGEDF